jgi:putative DNA primase/helicase
MIAKNVRQCSPEIPAQYAGPIEADVVYLPLALKTTAQWVLWRGVHQTDRLRKPPYTVNLALADITCPHDWSTLARCLNALPVALEEWQTDASQPYHGGGIGFVLTAHDPFCGIDLDHCVDPITGGVAPWAQRVLRHLDSYAELSPSGTGIHIFVRGSLDRLQGNKRGPVELYDRQRYLTMTGWHVTNTPRTIETRQAELTGFHRYVFPPSTPTRGTAPPVTPSTQTDDAVFETASRRYGSRFLALWAGAALPGKPRTHSEEDFELVCMLARCTPDCAQVDRLFRHSGLMRDKWDRRLGENTYGARTITNAYTRLQRYTQRCPTDTNTVGHQSNNDRQERKMIHHIATDSTQKG